MVEVINMEFSSIQLKMLSYLIDFFYYFTYKFK